MLENPIFIVGTEKSGSNLLRLMLNEHSNIAIPHSPNLMKDLSPLESKYGDLKKNYQSLVRDAIKLVDLHFVPWPFKVDATELWQLPHRNLYCVYAGIYDQYLNYTGKKRWGCKSTYMIHHLRDILAHHKEPRFIHLVRDPRDVAVSAKKSVFNHYHPYYVAKRWQNEQRIALRYRQDLKKQWLTVRYEDLVKNPESKLREICNFLNEPFEEAMLHFSEQKTARDLAKLSPSFLDLTKPVFQNTQNFLSLEQKDIHIIESICKDEMENFSYSTLHKYFIDSKPLDKAQYYILEKLQKMRTEIHSMVKDNKTSVRRMQKRIFLKKRKWLPFRPNR